VERQTELDPIIDTFADCFKRYTDERIEAACQPLRAEIVDMKDTIAAMIEAFQSLKSE
jgi:hypothetical protein